MITISDKRFGELIKNSALLDTYKSIANSQYDVIQRQEEASKAGMAEIKRLREELEALKSVLESVRADRNAWREEYENTKNSLGKAEYALKETRAKLEASILLGTLFMAVAATKE